MCGGLKLPPNRPIWRREEDTEVAELFIQETFLSARFELKACVLVVACEGEGIFAGFESQAEFIVAKQQVNGQAVGDKFVDFVAPGNAVAGGGQKAGQDGVACGGAVEGVAVG